MKFSVGDPIILKATQQEGEVVEILENDMFLVKVDGILFPSYPEDLEHPYLKWFLSDKLKGLKQKESTTETVQLAEQIALQKETFKQFSSLKTGLHISAHPKFLVDFFEETLDGFDIYLVNKSDYHLKVAVLHDENPIKVINSYPNDLIALYYCSLNEFNEGKFPSLEISWSSKKNQVKVEYKHVLSIKLSVKKLFGFLPKLREDRTKHFSQHLFSDFEDIMVQAQPSIAGDTEHQKINIENPREPSGASLSSFYEADRVIDLHFEVIGDLYVPSEHPSILSFQINYALDQLSLLQAKGVDEVWIIHGVGDGTLKTQVHQILKETPEIVVKYEYGYFEQYGFGATKVFLMNK